MCKLAGPQQREIGSPIPTNNASWRGPQHREIGTPISTDNASWGRTSIKKYFFFRN
ncbi:TPA: hypothetical protein I1Q59_001584 [Staphylococcus aureus]|nr:hypothetical protein [Staphylococcus aureus]HCY6628927.1 hypothetical protein [Staphylococcus aureus]HDD6795427.1 hypothetical protein [Staphylococcus aureus]HDX1726179.1 hypothetical protein [Staphylococcus aureus]